MAVQLTIVLLFAVIVILVWHFCKYKKIYALAWNLPGPLALPLLGNALNFICKDEDMFDKATQICSKYPSPMRIWFGPKLSVVVTDVTQAEKIMSSIKFITKDEAIYKFIEPVDGKGLITSSGSKWKRDRRLMSPLFLKRNIQQYFPNIVEHTKILVKVLQDRVNEPTFNIIIYVHKCVVDFVNETIMGTRTRVQFGEMQRFIELSSRMYTILHARIMKVWLQFDVIFRLSKYWKEYEEGLQYLLGFFHKVLETARENHSHSGHHTFRTIIDQLLDIQNEVPNFADTEELVHHLATLYTASEDTVTSIASFAIVLLGMYPEIQRKAVEEISLIIGNKKRDIEEIDLPKFVYLDMVIKDILRLFPIAPFIARTASDDFQIDQWTIPKGCSVIVSIQNIHRDHQHWERPNEFYPDHFLPERVQNRHPYAFMPFSAGPRACIGKPLAYMSLKIILVTLLQNFKIESDGTLQDKPLKMDISVRFKDEKYPVRLTPRELDI